MATKTQVFQLLSKDSSKNLHLNPKAVSLLEQITDPLVIVSVAGPTRTGKSFFCNFLTGIENRGFEESATTKCQTMGVWMSLTKHPLDPSKTLLVLDTEGIASTDGSHRVDEGILALSFVISSVFVYNLRGTITDSALQGLLLTSTIAQHFHQRSKTRLRRNRLPSSLLPSVIVTVRDSGLKVAIDGQENPTDTEHLHHSLDQIISKSKKDNIDCNLVKSLAGKCFMLKHPKKDTDDDTPVHEMTQEDFNKDFLKKLHDCKDYILAKGIESGSPFSGTEIVKLIEVFLQLQNAGNLAFQDMPDQLFHFQCKAVLERAKDYFKARLASRTNCIMSDNDLIQFLQDAKTQADAIVSDWTDRSLGMRFPFALKLDKFIQEESEEFVKLNLERRLEQIQSVFDERFQVLEDGMLSYAYIKNNGSTKWHLDVSQFWSDFDNLEQSLCPDNRDQDKSLTILVTKDLRENFEWRIGMYDEVVKASENMTIKVWMDKVQELDKEIVAEMKAAIDEAKQSHFMATASRVGSRVLSIGGGLSSITTGGLILASLAAAATIAWWVALGLGLTSIGIYVTTETGAYLKKRSIVKKLQQATLNLQSYVAICPASSSKDLEKIYRRGASLLSLALTSEIAKCLEDKTVLEAPKTTDGLSKDEQEAFNIVAGIQDGPQRNVLYQVVQIVLLQEELQEKDVDVMPASEKERLEKILVALGKAGKEMLKSFKKAFVKAALKASNVGDILVDDVAEAAAKGGAKRVAMVAGETAGSTVRKVAGSLTIVVAALGIGLDIWSIHKALNKKDFGEYLAAVLECYTTITK